MPNGPRRTEKRLAEPPEGEGLSTERKLEELDANLERLGHVFDALEDPQWREELPSRWLEELSRRWTPGPRNLLQILGYLRDEEAFVFGRRLMRLIEEHAPTFEHLTFELASNYRDYGASKPAEHFSEFVKNRVVWMHLVREAGPMAEIKKGELPPEEGGTERTMVEILDDAMRRDRTVHRLVREMRLDLWKSAP